MANMDTGKSLANGNKRNNRAKAQVDGRLNSAFGQGQGMATSRQNPTDANRGSAKNTTDGEHA